jgi:putative aminopeptidase FrvX
MDSTVEMVQLDDFENAARLIAAVARRLGPETRSAAASGGLTGALLDRVGDA